MMQKFDELISYFNRKVSEMEIGTSYKMELLGMVTALGYAHEKETEERKTGRWIQTHRGERGFSRTGFRCDQCGEVNPRSNYCPNCGSFNGGNDEE